MLLASNIWHNNVRPTDVDGDGFTAPIDALILLDEINNRGGSRPLSEAGARTNNGEGEAGGQKYLDVNGDGHLSPRDVLDVVHRLNAEAEPRGGEWVRFRLKTFDTNYNPITEIGPGQEFLVRVTVEDIRDENGIDVDGSGGVGAAYLDLQYDAGDLQVKPGTSTAKPGVATELDFTITFEDPDSPFEPGEGFDDFVFPYSNGISGVLTDPADRDLPNGPLEVGEGVVNEVGGFTTITFGYNEKFVADITVRSKAVGAVDDSFNATEDQQATLPVLANGDGIPSGPTTIRSGLSDFRPSSAVVMLAGRFENDPLEVQDDEIDFNDVTIDITNTANSFRISRILGLPAGHRAVVGNNGTPNNTTDDVILYTPPANFNGPVTFQYEVSDGTNTDIADVTVNVAAVNDAPVADDVTGPAATEDGAAVQGNFDADDVDADDDPNSLTYRIVAQPSEGTASTDGGRAFTFDPEADFQDLGEGATRQVTFDYRARDSQNVNSNIATVTITVTGVNDAPSAVDDNLNASNSGDTVSLNVLANDTDPDAGDTKTVVELQNTGGIQGTVTIAPDGKSVSYTPPASLVGQVVLAGTFDYVMEDSEGVQSTATVTVNLVDNQAPVAQDDALSTNEDTRLTGVSVLANNGSGPDTDPDGDALAVSAFDATSTRGATVSINRAGVLTYDPRNAAQLQALAVGATAQDTFTYTLEDESGATDTATVTVTVTGVNDAPTAANQNLSTPEDDPLTGNLNSFADDVDTGDALTFTVTTDVTNGRLTVNSATGGFNYRPNAEYSGPDSFTFTAEDESGATATATVNITVTIVNDAPVSRNVSVVVTRQGTSTHDFDVSDVDNTAAQLTILIVDPLAAGEGTVTVNNNRTFTFDPGSDFDDLAPGASRTVDFTYAARDPGQAVGNTSTVSIRVIANNPPDAKDDGGFTTDEGTTETGDVFADNGNGADSDNEDDPFTVTDFTATSAKGATVTVAAGGAFTYNPADSATLNALSAGETTTDTFTYTITDEVNGAPSASDTATVTIRVRGVNDPAVASDATVTTPEDTRLNATARDHVADPDAGDTLTFSLESGVTHGRLTLRGDGTYSYTPDADFFGTDSFTFKVSDGTVSDTATITIDVASVNDAPTATDDMAMVLKDGGVRTIKVLTNDIVGPASESGQRLAIARFTAPTVTRHDAGTNEPGTLRRVGRDFEYEPAPGFVGIVTFTYTARDNGTPVAEDTATVTIEVVDFVPSVISGFVYHDVDNDSRLDTGELGFGNIEVRLTGTDAFGSDIDYSVFTDPRGFYQFTTNGAGDPLAPGMYRVHAGQPDHVGDGKDRAVTPGVAQPNDTQVNQFRVTRPGNDLFDVKIGLFGGADVKLNFGEYGWPTWAFPATLASDEDDGFVILGDLSGNQYWNASLANFDCAAILIDASNGLRSPVKVTVVHANGDRDARMIDMTAPGTPLKLMGRDGDMHMFRFEGTMDDFINSGTVAAAEPAANAEGEAAAPAPEGGEQYAQAVDRVMGAWA